VMRAAVTVYWMWKCGLAPIVGWGVCIRTDASECGGECYLAVRSSSGNERVTIRRERYILKKKTKELSAQRQETGSEGAIDEDLSGDPSEEFCQSCPSDCCCICPVMLGLRIAAPPGLKTHTCRVQVTVSPTESIHIRDKVRLLECVFRVISPLR
jgi:hypothetical protein